MVNNFRAFVVLKLVALVLLLCSVAVVADPWTGEGEFGFVQVTGNTESETLNAAFEAEKKHGKWTHIAKAAAVQATSNDVDSAESYLAGWRSEHSFSERAYSFGDLNYFDDRFDSYEEIYTAALGIGYKAIMRDHLTWDVSAGVGYRDTTVELTQEVESGLAYLLESDYKHTLTETTQLENYTRVEIGDFNTFSKNKTSLSVTINSILALRASYEIRHNSDPEPGFEATDRITSINIVLKF